MVYKIKKSPNIISSFIKKLGDIKYIDNLPFLFPLNVQNKLYYFDQNNNLIFNDDLLKSAFYLLSGYQEIERHSVDQYGRFHTNRVYKKD